jgi:hypothetical protein
MDRVRAALLNFYPFVLKIYRFSSDKSDHVLHPPIKILLTVARTIDQLNLYIRSMNWKWAEFICLTLLEWIFRFLFASPLIFSVLKLCVVLFVKGVYQMFDEAWFSKSSFAKDHYIQDLNLFYLWGLGVVWVRGCSKVCEWKCGLFLFINLGPLEPKTSFSVCD